MTSPRHRSALSFTAPTEETHRSMAATTARIAAAGRALRRLGSTAMVVAGITAMLSIAAEAAQAASPVLSISSLGLPTHFAPGTNSYVVTVTNTSSVATDGSAITITDTLPSGLTVDPAGLGIFTGGVAVYPEVGSGGQGGGGGGQSGLCDPGPPVTCVVGTGPDLLEPGQSASMFVIVTVGAGAPATLTNHVSVTGGGAPPASATESTPVSETPAAFGFQTLGTSITDAAGNLETQAGAHPYAFRTGFQLNTIFDTAHANPPVGTPKDIAVKLAPGMVVSPTATPVRCTEAELEDTVNAAGDNGCPDASAVGIARPTVGFGGYANPILATPIYNMVPSPGTPAELGFNAAGLGLFVHLLGGVDAAGNYQLTADVKDVPQFGILSGAYVDLWGDPSDPSHDNQRGHCEGGAAHYNGRTCPVARSGVPFLTMPSACSGSLATSFSVDSWGDPGNFVSAQASTLDSRGNPVGVTGCSRLAFNPTLTIQPDTTAANAPTGLDVDLKVPQTNSVDQLATANLKRTVVRLPAGVAVSTAAADGLGSCSPGQIGLTTPVGQRPVHFSAAADSCPDSAKIGSVEITTPLLADPLQGSIYLAQQDQNPFGSLLALYVAIKDPTTGIVIKLPGQVDADLGTGQLTATFDDAPQLPFSDFKLHFNGGPRAALVTPSGCGAYQTSSTMSPWSAADPDSPTVGEISHGMSSFSLDQNCDRGGFAPQLTAGLGTVSAGRSSAFTLRLTRPDGDQNVASLETTLPPGLLAKIAGVPLCPEASAGPGDCPAASQIGQTTAAIGAGPAPLYVPQAGKTPTGVYLAGPYRGAPYSLVIKVPAQAGPFDLGTVAIRAAIFVDPIDAHVTVKSDPLPQIIRGIPLRYRDVRVTIDRSGFMLAPTSCNPMQILADVTGTSLGGPFSANPAGIGFATTTGTVAHLSSPFQVGGCSDLGLSPKLAISLTGKGQTTDDKHPGVHAVVSQPAGQANLKKVVVSLPLSLALDPDNANGLCEFTDGSKVDPTCPKASIVGKAVARTPILDQPLSGPVYFVKNVRKDPKSGREIRTLPKLVIPLTGENGLRLNLVGASNVVDNRLVTTFDNIPDAPVSDFTLDINGGKGGILVVSGTDICKATQVAAQEVDGQNGKTADADVYLQTTACALKVLSKKVGKTSVAVKVGGLGAGKVTVSGKGIKKTRKTIAKSTVATITAKRTKGKPGKVTVSFDPTGPAKARKTTK
jgi:uncharacterized repeat protein (TIGR01451 family)